jgi:hypothetical protein
MPRLFQERPESIARRRVLGLGISQSGRFLRHFVKQGFNADESGRQVFDGLFVHVAGAGIGSFNHRFAQPSRDAQPVSALVYPTDLFPFTDLPETDPETGETAGLLDRARAEKVAPKIFTTNTSYEYWGRAASLVATSPDGAGRGDSGRSPRLYPRGPAALHRDFPSERGTFPRIASLAPAESESDRLAVAGLLRRHGGVGQGRRRAAGEPHPKPPTDLPRAALEFPAIPGLPPPARAHEALRLDFGPRWKEGLVAFEPPRAGKPFATLVPRADADGNDASGVRIAEMAVPVATYTGWNLRDPKTGLAGERVSFVGSRPFPKTCRPGADRRSAAIPGRAVRLARTLSRSLRGGGDRADPRAFPFARGPRGRSFARRRGVGRRGQVREVGMPAGVGGGEASAFGRFSSDSR